jgi:hypothetical protein
MDALDLSRWQFGITTVYGDRLGAALPAATMQLGQSWAAADRIVAVLDTPDPVGIPAEPFPAPVAERGTYRELIAAGGVFQQIWQGDDQLAERGGS